ncbi:MAG TPA: DNA-processing protein DprA [bacterium]|nr:DNA-processing protein DprA [bacterium]
MGMAVRTEELLGELNVVERKFAPSELFCEGDVTLLQEPSVSIVGSRSATKAGLARARRFAMLLVERGITVVSGLADGIDTAAHWSAIENGGRTIAVLGTPLDKASPAKNRDLQGLIMREHLAVSQFAPGTKTGRHSFPLRNRTMALISGATVIMEAVDGSGSLHQAWEAIRLGRQVFVAKSLVDNAELEFPQELVSYGAEVLENEESVSMLCSELPRSRREQSAAIPF